MTFTKQYLQLVVKDAMMRTLDYLHKTVLICGKANNLRSGMILDFIIIYTLSADNVFTNVQKNRYSFNQIGT